jgi:hypothetical protein
MLHLLPEYQKKKVIAEYRLRLSVVSILLLAVSILIFAVFLMPSYVYLYSAKSELAARKSGLSSIIQARSGGISNKTGIDVPKSIAALIPMSGSLEPISYMDQLVSTSPAVHVTSYFFAPVSGGRIGVMISGMADNRESLAAYADDLDKKFGGVKLPLSSLAKQSNIPFDFRFEVDQAKLGQK